MTTAATKQIVAELGGGRSVRLTVGVLEMFDMARYNVHRREGWEWLEAHGYAAVPMPKAKAAEQDTEEAEPPEPPEAHELRMMMAARAQMLAALKGVEERSGPKAEWQPSALPEEWAGVDGFVRINAATTNVWHRWTLVLNPTVFLNTMGEPEKNGDAVIVS